MRAWTVDADDIRVAEDFVEALLHRTPEIDGFLAADRDDKFIVIGTKGFGKTLLLKAKRVLVQREGKATCLPQGSLLDKPIGDKIFGRETIAFFAASPLPWSRLWFAAIALAVLKHTGDVEGLKVNPRLAALLRDAQLRGVIDHFVRLLDLSPSELQRVGADTDGHLVPRLRALKSPLTLFIDGIDEYFSKHVEASGDHPSVTGELSPQVWHFAQLGLAEVAYQLRRINHHLKVYAAIRKEAYASLPRRTAMAQQYRGSAVDIAYTPESLREIFVNNVRLVKSDRMVRPARANDHPRGRGRVRVRLPPHAAASARPDDDRRAPRRAAPRRTSPRASAEGRGAPCRGRDRAGIPRRGRPLSRRPRSRRLAAARPRPDPHPRRGRRARRRRGRRQRRPRAVGAVPRRAARLGPARPRTRRVAAAFPASRRSAARPRRGAAAGGRSE